MRSTVLIVPVLLALLNIQKASSRAIPDPPVPVGLVNADGVTQSSTVPSPPIAAATPITTVSNTGSASASPFPLTSPPTPSPFGTPSSSMSSTTVSSNPDSVEPAVPWISDPPFFAAEGDDEDFPPSSTSTRELVSWEPQATPGSPIQWIAFGDSYTSTGFSLDGALPEAGNPMGNPAYPGLTSSNGENWLNLVATKHNLTLTLVWNFAKYGARVSDAGTFVDGKPAMPVYQQVDEFLYGYETRFPDLDWQGDRSVISFFVGINDIWNGMVNTDANDYQFTISLLQEQLKQKIARLYTYHAKNFLLFNIPPMDRSPFIRNKGFAIAAKEAMVIENWNRELENTVRELRDIMDINVELIDTHTVFEMVMDAPITFGLDSNMTAYGPNQTLFWGDHYHPNTKVHDVLAFEVAGVLQDTGFWDV